MNGYRWRHWLLGILILYLAGTAMAGQPRNAIWIGLDADLSSGSARSGEAIRRGILLAIDEINAEGGVLGCPLRLMVRDHRGNPARGCDNIEDLAEIPNLVAVVGGLHTPVALAELKAIHRHGLIFLIPWAAGTPLVDNGYSPNYVFRISVRDAWAGGFLVTQAVCRGYRRLYLLLEQTGWGRSNQQAMTTALAAHNLAPAGVSWFHWGAKTVAPLLKNALAAQADAVLLVANAPEGATVIQDMAQLPEIQRLPIFSHWGITGGRFFDAVRPYLGGVNLYFLQTFSFIDPPFPDRAQTLFERYQRVFADVDTPAQVFAPAGTAHAYDLIHLLRQAIETAGVSARAKVRDALEHLDAHQGLVRYYDPAFTPQRHDALTREDFRLAQFDDQGVIIPLAPVQCD